MHASCACRSEWCTRCRLQGQGRQGRTNWMMRLALSSHCFSPACLLRAMICGTLRPSEPASRSTLNATHLFVPGRKRASSSCVAYGPKADDAVVCHHSNTGYACA